MLTLSILIAAHDDSQLEASLVSVLQHRPAHCEVVVVRNEGYQDPYDLSDEVRFVLVPAASDLATRLNLGLRHCQGAIVNLLTQGTEVVDGWSEPALRHFVNAQIGAVAPVLLAPGGKKVLTAGIGYQQGGARLTLGQGADVGTISPATPHAIGPALEAAFYRASALEQLSGPFDPLLGDKLIDVDLALRLAQHGYRSGVELHSVSIASGQLATRQPLCDAWLAERLYWRHARGQQGAQGSLLSHLRVIGAECASILVHPWRAGQILGRAAGWLEHIVSGKSKTERADQPKLGQVRTVGASTIRVDNPQQPGPRTPTGPRHDAPRAA